MPGTGPGPAIIGAVNPLTLATLRLLSHDRHVSGEAVASSLGVTRATVWNAVREAEALGLLVERVRGHGYRLTRPCTWLDAEAIAAGLGEAAGRLHLEVLPHTASTNSDLMERARSGAPAGTVLTTELQTGGRGRRGRRWTSPLGSGLAFSLLWRFDAGAAGLSGLSLAVGLACVAALDGVGARSVGLKWPNDLLAPGGKLGGILIELQGDSLGPSTVVIGVGINVALPADLSQAVGQPVSDVVSAGGVPDRNRLQALLLRELVRALDGFAAEGYAALRERFDQRHVLQDCTVDVTLADGRVVTGLVAGTDRSGALLLDTPTGRQVFHGGEVSVRTAGRA